MQSPFTHRFGLTRACEVERYCGDDHWVRLTRKTDPLGWLGGEGIQATKHKLMHTACLKQIYIIHYFNSASTTYPGHWMWPEKETAQHAVGAAPAQVLSPGTALSMYFC